MLFNQFIPALKYKMCADEYNGYISDVTFLTSYTKYGELNDKKQNIGPEKDAWNTDRRG